MIIEIDGYFLRTILRSDKEFSKGDLINMYDDLKNNISRKQLPETLCRLYSMEKQEEMEGLRIDIVIDTDTDRIYKPQY